MTAVLGQGQALAAELIAKLIKEYAEGISDREEEAVAFAGRCGLDVKEVREGFANAREVREAEGGLFISSTPQLGEESTTTEVAPKPTPEPGGLRRFARKIGEPTPTNAEPEVANALQAAMAELTERAEPEPKPKPKEAKAPEADPAKGPKAKAWLDAPLPPNEATDLERLTYPHGLLGHVIQYMVDASDLPDRWLALASALVVLAKGLDRKVLGPSGTSTVLYILLMAESGAGKQQAIRTIRMVLKAMGLEHVIAANSLASVQAIEEIVEEMPSALILCDEIGGWLNRISATGQTGNVAEIPATLQSLWAWSPELNWIGTKRKGKEMVTVFGPALSIFGDSTEAKLIKGLTKEEIANGFLNRWLLFGIGRGAPRRVKPKYHWTEIPKWLEKAIKEVVGKPVDAKGLIKLTLPKEDGSGVVVLQDFERIGWGPGAEELWLNFEEHTRAMPSAKDRDLWIRAPEQAVRLATILAFYRGSKVVEVKDWEWAVEVVKYSMSQLVRSLGKHQREKLEQVELVDKIREEFLREDLPPSSGRKIVGELTEGQINKLCERLTEDFWKIDKAIQHLLKVGEIEEFTPDPPRRGPPTRHFRWKG